MKLSESPYKTLGPKTARLFTTLHEQNRLVFDLKTAADAMQTDHVHATSILHAAIKRGLVTPIKRGLYNLVPFEMGAVTSHLQDRYEIIATSMGSIPYCFSYASALDLHRLVTQPVFDSYVSTTRRTSTKRIAGTLVHFVTTPQDLFFGTETVRIRDQFSVVVNDLERSLVDGLVNPAYCNGFVEVAKAFFMAKSRLDLTKLISYSKKIRRDSVIRRLGFILETLQLAPSQILDELAQYLPTGTSVLDPTLPVVNASRNSKWGLRLTVTADEILKAVSN